MADELTPFPDGEGYMDFAWGSLTYPQVVALFRAAGRDFAPTHPVRPATWKVLTRYGLVIRDADHTVTPRGRALVDWVYATGRWDTHMPRAHGGEPS